MQPLDVMIAAIAWLLNVVTLAGVSSYAPTFAADPAAHMASGWLKNTEDVVVIINGSYNLVSNAAINSAKLWSVVTMLA